MTSAASARAAYQDFLTLWKDADPDIPILNCRQVRVRQAEIISVLRIVAAGVTQNLPNPLSFGGLPTVFTMEQVLWLVYGLMP
jgi:hypothetical protein